MAIRECGNGHVYDADQYAACPYCNGGTNMINFDGGNGGGRTMAPTGYNATVAPQMQPPLQSRIQPSMTPYMGGTDPAAGYGVPGEEPGKTVAPESYRKRMDAQNKTVGVFKKKYDLEPVVGWLVCIEGPEKGKDYHLWAKINTIGRSDRMDVCIHDDMTISKENHARLAYDPKHNSFQLIPGESTNNIYLNDEPIYVPARLAAYDVIEFGESKMVFVPFCNDRFRWTTGLKQGE